MKRLLATSALATLLAGAAVADPLVDAAQDMLNRYNVAVDASTLTDSQLARLHFLDTSDNSQAAIENRIEGIVNADDAQPFPAIEEPIVAEAQMTLDRYGYDEVDASTLTDSQLARLHLVDGEGYSDDAQAKVVIDSILQ